LGRLEELKGLLQEPAEPSLCLQLALLVSANFSAA
jgi:hypothetical protein